MATRSSNAETSACQYALQTILAEPLQLTCLRLSCVGLGAVRTEIPLGAGCASAAFAVKALRRNFRQQQLHRVKNLRVLWWSRAVAYTKAVTQSNLVLVSHNGVSRTVVVVVMFAVICRGVMLA